MINPIKSGMSLHNLELPIYLGWSEGERSTKQIITLDIYVRFFEPPAACQTDNLADTYCYDVLIKMIESYIATQTFCLIENVGHTIYQFVKKTFLDNALVSINIHKKPNIDSLKNGVSFCYGDF